MITAFTIYIRALGIYALITLPSLVLPYIYILSLGYAFVFGWFAWLVFSLLSLAVVHSTLIHHYRILLLSTAVPVSVAFAFQMIEVFDAFDNVWHSGGFLIFPLAATISGWISLGISENKFQVTKQEQLEIETKMDVYENK